MILLGSPLRPLLFFFKYRLSIIQSDGVIQAFWPSHIRPFESNSPGILTSKYKIWVLQTHPPPHTNTYTHISSCRKTRHLKPSVFFEIKDACCWPGYTAKHRWLESWANWEAVVRAGATWQLKSVDRLAESNWIGSLPSIPKRWLLRMAKESRDSLEVSPRCLGLSAIVVFIQLSLSGRPKKGNWFLCFY